MAVTPLGCMGGEIFGALPASEGRTMKGRFAAFVVVCMLHIMNSADVIRMLKADGWEEVTAAITSSNTRPNPAG